MSSAESTVEFNDYPLRTSSGPSTKPVTRWVFLLLLALSWTGLVATAGIAGGSTSFVFSAVGDFSSTAHTTSNLAMMNASQSSFILALGDLSYGSPGGEQSWCNYVKSLVSPRTPFELLSGNHEDGGEQQNGLIDNFATCLPDKLGVTGIYGKEYYFDFPAANPLARFIEISPNLKLTYGNGTYPNGVFWNYTALPSPTPHYTWLVNVIHQARASNIPWVIVAMHKTCVTSGVMGCEIGPDVMNLLLSQKVDLILQGHEHSYQRSKQLSCATTGSFTASCVTNDGSTGNYVKGQGSVIVIDGTGGIQFESLEASSPERPYFARWNNDTWGYSMYNVTPDRIDQMFMPTTGSFSDSFSIVKSANPVSTSMVSPASASSAVNTPVQLAASASGGVQPYSYSWRFGDNMTGSGNPTSHSYTIPGTYVVDVLVNDASGQWAQAFMNLIVCAPIVTTLSRILGNQTGPNGGATFAGGGFTPGIPNKRDSAPPCFVSGNSTLVEVRNLRILNTPDSNSDCASFFNGRFCDTSFSVADPAYLSEATCPVCYLHRLEVEIDQSWKSQGNAPPFPNMTSIGSSQISIDGFVYWDPQHTTEKWHAYSGWELHPVVSWRLVGASSLSASFNVSNPAPYVGAVDGFNASATGGLKPYVYSWNFGDGTGGQGNVTSHAFSSPGVYTVSLRVTDASGQVAGGVKMVSVPQPDFDMGTVQSAIVLVRGYSANLTIVLASLKGFNGNVTLTVSLSPSGSNSPRTSWNSTLVIVPGNSTGSVVLTMRTLTSTGLGSYLLTLAASSGAVSHTSSVNIVVTSSTGGGGGRPPLNE